jgi:hypothetical protein
MLSSSSCLDAVVLTFLVSVDLRYISWRFSRDKSLVSPSVCLSIAALLGPHSVAYYPGLFLPSPSMILPPHACFYLADIWMSWALFSPRMLSRDIHPKMLGHGYLYVLDVPPCMICML